MSALQLLCLHPESSATLSGCCLLSRLCTVYLDRCIQNVHGTHTKSVSVTEKHQNTCKWVFFGLCAAAHHHVPIPPGTGLPLFPFPVSPLTPTVSTNCERGTKDTATTRLISAIVDIQQCTPSKMKQTQNAKSQRKFDCRIVLLTSVSF